MFAVPWLTETVASGDIQLRVRPETVAVVDGSLRW
jgi:hypothetical protein